MGIVLATLSTLSTNALGGGKRAFLWFSWLHVLNRTHPARGIATFRRNNEYPFGFFLFIFSFFSFHFLWRLSKKSWAVIGASTQNAMSPLTNRCKQALIRRSRPLAGWMGALIAPASVQQSLQWRETVTHHEIDDVINKSRGPFSICMYHWVPVEQIHFPFFSFFFVDLRDFLVHTSIFQKANRTRPKCLILSSKWISMECSTQLRYVQLQWASQSWRTWMEPLPPPAFCCLSRVERWPATSTM